MNKKPIFLEYEFFELKEVVEWLKKKLEKCDLCPRKCEVNRLKGEIGICGITTKVVVSSYFLHTGEEFPIRGYRGSGTIFFSGCNLKCIFCQNYEISHLMEGNELEIEELAEIMIFLQKAGAHNINLVTPTHVTPFIFDAVIKAIEKGLKIPIVYNTSAYDSLQVIKKLQKFVDIYMPDFKFWSGESSKKYMKALDYPEIAKKVIKEMYEQVGGLKTDAFGIAVSGLLIRHLVMPNHIQDSFKILEWIKENTPDAYVNVMAQYYPYFKAYMYEEINRRIYMNEFYEVLNKAKELKLKLVLE